MLRIRKMAHHETHNQTHNKQTQGNKNMALLRGARFSCLRNCSVSQRFQFSFSFSFANSVVVAGFHHSYCLVRLVVEVVDRGRGRERKQKKKKTETKKRRNEEEEAQTSEDDDDDAYRWKKRARRGARVAQKARKDINDDDDQTWS